MKIISFNVNGLRARLHQLQAVIEQHNPAIIGLQEIKVDNEQFPVDDIHALGYDVIYHGPKGHYGVALLYKPTLIESLYGFPNDDEDVQKRLISGLFEVDGQKIRIFNGYFPQGESRDRPTQFPNKQWFYQQLTEHLQQCCNAGEQVIVMGDMNVAPDDADIGIGPDNMKRWLRTGKCCFLPEEREWFNRLTDLGITDTFRHFYPNEAQRFSWFDYRSRGFEREPKRGLRIDFILASQPLLEKSSGAGIDYELRAMEKPSDHCPIWLELNL